MKDARKTKTTKKAPKSYQRTLDDLSYIFVEAADAVMNGLINPEKLSRKDIARFTLIMISSYGYVLPAHVQLFTAALYEDNKS